MLGTTNLLGTVVLTNITRPATLTKTNVLRIGVHMTIFASYLEFTHKSFLTTITRAATLKKTNFLRNGVDMMIFAWYFEFTQKSGFKYYNTSSFAKKESI